MPLISVVIPVHGVEAYLDRCLDSVLGPAGQAAGGGEAPTSLEVIAVDDASPDPVRLDASHARGCTLVRRDRPGGAPAARDTALARLDTEWLALADADDVWRGDRLAA